MKSSLIKTIKQNGVYSNKLTIISRIYQKYARVISGANPVLPSNDRYNISLCHEKKFIWFRVAKVGTRTIFSLFNQNNIELDAEHAMSCHYPVNRYKEYFKFGFVRNPWDRLVSCWKNKVIETNYFNFDQDELVKMQNFESFVHYVSGLQISTCDHHLRLQSKLIDINHIDFIGRFENFDDDLNTIMKKINLYPTEIKRLNVSKDISNYKTFYNKSLEDKVSDIYSLDIHLFSYKFEKT